MKIWLAIAVTLVGIPARAQVTIQNLVTECGKKCSGTFTLVNESLTPATFTVDPYSITFVHEVNRPVLRKVDADVKLKLSSMSGRLSPKESREVNFSFQCSEAQADCQVMFLSTLILGKAKDSDVVNYKFVLPHTAYACATGAKNCRKKTLDDARVTPPTLPSEAQGNS